MTIAEPKNFAEEIAHSHDAAIAEADDLLQDIAKENRVANYAELVFFQKVVGWDEIEVRNQLRRMNNVLRFQAIAGSIADREASKAEAITSAKIMETESPKLQAKIEELQTKLSALDRDARLSSKRVEEQSAAADNLRKLCPLHIAKSVQHAVGTIEASIGRQVRDAESRSHELECCLDKSRYANDEAYFEMLRRSFRDAVAVTNDNKIRKLSLSPEWPSIKAAIESELAEIRTMLEPLRKQHAEMIAQAEKPLSFYS